MSKPQDGFVSRFLNRPISRRITSFLLKFPIHPNAWTISIFVLPLIAGAFLVRGGYKSVVIGAAIFQVFSILDGCDGEIARAKDLESKRSEEHTSELQSQSHISYAVFCLKKTKAANFVPQRSARSSTTMRDIG